MSLGGTGSSSPALEPWWNWQQLTWLLPAALLVASLWRLLLWRRARRDEPWHALQRWGARVFRPRSAGETPLEYGRALAAAAEALADGTTSVEEGLRSAAHRAANEARSLTAAVSAFHYAQPDSRPDAQALTRAHWRNLRPLLPRLTRRLRRRRSGPSGPLRPPVLN